MQINHDTLEFQFFTSEIKCLLRTSTKKTVCLLYQLRYLTKHFVLLQENLMLKAERIKKKVGMGGKQDIRVEEVQRKDRMERYI